ncbi:MAG: hypothetical protein QM499_00875 [Flavobacteriaceae bacterium]
MGKGYNNIKKIDVSKEEPISFVRKKIRSSDFVEPPKKEISDFNIDKFNIASLLFNLQDACNKYGIRYENVIVLIYLNELSVFRFDIKVLDRSIKLVEYLALGFIVTDFTAKKKNYYRITKYGKEIADYFYSTLNNSANYIKENRVLELDAKAKMKSVLADYYSD